MAAVLIGIVQDCILVGDIGKVLEVGDIGKFGVVGCDVLVVARLRDEAVVFGDGAQWCF